MPRSVQRIAVAIFMAATVIVSSACWLLGSPHSTAPTYQRWDGPANESTPLNLAKMKLYSMLSRLRLPSCEKAIGAA